MDKLYFDNLDETLYTEELTNGLKLYVLPKKGYQKTYATFTTKYGSVDREFGVNGDKIQVPDGIAHFLEHKMFEEEDGDVFNEFAKNGAQANAFTSFNRTTYLFSSTENVKTNLETLINFVQNPYFTDESVEKEKGIIAQEIRMYDDNPDWRLYFGLIATIYSKNPIRIDIAGTVDSIYQITKEHLYTCYKTFYHPSNMILFIVGGVEPEEIIQLVKQNQSQKNFDAIPNIVRYYPDEPRNVGQEKQEFTFPVALPKLLVGFKDSEINLSGKEFIKREISTQIMLEMIFGQSSNFYERLINKGIIDDDFSFEYQIEQQYAFSLLGGTTKRPKDLIDSIKEEIKTIKKDGFEQEIFIRTKKQKIGDFLRKMNSPEFIANQFTRYISNDANLFDILDILEAMNIEDIRKRIDHLNEELMALSIVNPV